MNQSLMLSLKKRYGGRAEEVYSKMKSEGHKATSKQAIAKSKKHHPEYYKPKKRKSRIMAAIKKKTKK